MAATQHPLIPPPPPRFPTQFTDDQPSSTAVAEVVGWPEGHKEAGEAVGGSEQPRVGEVVWQLKTDGEEHVERLESRLEQVRSQPPPTFSDAGYGAATLVEEAFGEQENLALRAEDEGDAQAAGDEDEEGQALLSSVDQPAMVEPRGRTPTPRVKGRRSVDVYVLTEDESPDMSDDEAPPSQRHLPFRMPANLAINGSHRISFSDSVRIGGRGTGRSHRHQQHLPDVFQPSAPAGRTALGASQARSLSASPYLVASVTASTSPSRSISPGPSRSRRPSLSSSHLSSSGFAHLHPYSTSPASYGASRSSSPGSSIYAPLQPPSRHCPNPMFVRPVGAVRGIRRTRSNSTVSFQEYLRSGGRLPIDLEDDSDDLTASGGEDPAPHRQEYRDLVEQQRLQKAKWEARRRALEEQRPKQREVVGTAGGGFWDRFAALLALGMAGSGSGRGVPPSPAVVKVLSASSSPVSHAGRGTSPSRPSPLRRPSSASPLAPSERDPLILPRSIPRREPRPTKSELDVRFGPAPARYFRWSWIKWQIKRVVEAAKGAVETALRGWRMSRREQAVLENGYEEV
ncbi:hypothetical protein JCM11641_008099 [Rhodosporidiobolus odoratus]